jgi:hypothetical protein
MMIGIGIPISQSSAPLPKPIVLSPSFVVNPNSERIARFRAEGRGPVRWSWPEFQAGETRSKLRRYGFGKMDLGMPGQEDFTAKQAEYRSHAEKMRQMAAEATDEVERNTLLRIADAWAQLAKRMGHLAEGLK